MVLGIHANSARSPRHHIARQGLWPTGVYFVFRYANLRSQGTQIPNSDRKACAKHSLAQKPCHIFHTASLKYKIQFGGLQVAPKPALRRCRVEPALYSGGLQAEPAPVPDLQPAITHAAGSGF